MSFIRIESAFEFTFELDVPIQKEVQISRTPECRPLKSDLEDQLLISLVFANLALLSAQKERSGFTQKLSESNLILLYKPGVHKKTTLNLND